METLEKKSISIDLVSNNNSNFISKNLIEYLKKIDNEESIVKKRSLLKEDELVGKDLVNFIDSKF